MRKTKIVCTIGPASSDRAVFADMCRAGMNVARLNFSHGTHEEQKAKLDMIRSVREDQGAGIPHPHVPKREDHAERRRHLHVHHPRH